MPLKNEILSHGDETFEVLSYFRDQRRRYNSSRDFLTDLVKSHAADCHNEEVSLDEVENAFRREIFDRLPLASLEPPFIGLLYCALQKVHWSWIAHCPLLEFAIDNLRSPSKESTETSPPGVEFEKEGQ